MLKSASPGAPGEVSEGVKLMMPCKINENNFSISLKIDV